MRDENSSNPLVHVQNVRQQFRDIVNHLRDDIKKINEPQCKAMFETSAEILLGLIKAFDDYEAKNEDAWK